MNKTIKFVAITTGDPNGIGFEVTAKALNKIGPQKNLVFFVFRDHKQEYKQKKFFKLLDKKFSRLTFNCLESALLFSHSLKFNKRKKQNILIDMSLNSSAAHWVIEASIACKKKLMDGLVTGPISKTLIRNSKIAAIGHTGIFRKLYPRNNLFMAFKGKDFRILIATDHISLASVEKKLTSKLLKNSYFAAINFKNMLKDARPICILGLNPHAGENGIIGNFEKKWPHYLPKPLVPDAAFLKKNWKKYSVFVCLYHDQGLIPFKMHHGQDSGVHITIGLPFIRTSVDHGTAFELYNKNKANASSMIDAIITNLKMIGA